MASASAAHRDEPTDPPPPLRAEVGDILIIDEGGAAGMPRIGEIIAVLGSDGSPPYRVHWLAGEYESMILPGPGAHVEKRHRPRGTGAGTVTA